jgi:hypothetical protein
MAKPKHHHMKAEVGVFKLTGFATAQLFKPLPDDHPVYQTVGLIASETARIERLLDQSICNVASVDLKVGACLTGQMIGPGPRWNALLQLARHRGMSESILKRIKTTQGHSSDYFERRNRAVHDQWLMDDDTGEPHQFRGKSKAKPDFGPSPSPENALKDELTEIRKHRDEVNQLVSDIWLELRQASNETPPPRISELPSEGALLR